MLSIGLRFLVVLSGCLACMRSDALAQRLSLKVVLAKDVYFESEPIYLLLDLANNGGDTAWVGQFALVYNNLRVTITRDGQTPVPRQGLIVDDFSSGMWRGIPIAPGAHAYETAVLQSWWGDPPEQGSRLFRTRLVAGTYEVHAEFDAHGGLPLAPVLVDASPVSFVIRKRSASEDAIVREVESIRAMPWSPGQRAQSIRALIAWVDARASQAPDDPFIPFLLNQGLITAAASGISPERDQATKLKRLQIAAAHVQGSTPAGAAVIDAMAHDSAGLAAVASEAAGLLAGDVANYRLERLRAVRRRN